MNLLLGFVALALLGMALISILNALTYPRLRPGRLEQTPLVSILIPARNEAATIERTIRWLLAQDYPDFEIIVLDDASSDGTAAAVRRASDSDPRLLLFPGLPLPENWLGKSWACQQLSRQAKGDLLLFTDADVRWHPGALKAIVRQFQQSRAHLLAVFPTQETVTWGERLVIPLMGMAILGYLPIPAVHHIPWAAFAAANGQCLLFERAAYERIDGHQAVKTSLIEDVSLARLVKRHGLRLRLADGTGLVSNRMYGNWPEVRDGFAKNIIAGHGNLFFLSISTLFHWLAFVLPWAWLFVDWRSALPLVLLGVAVRALSAALTRQRLPDSLLMPLSVALMTVIALRAAAWQVRFGGPQWRGRAIQQ
ncbi:MAG: glycosyltransferase [Chloroflexota bacterium]